MSNNQAVESRTLQNAFTAIERMIQGYYHTKNPFHSPVTGDAQLALREIKDYYAVTQQPAQPDCRTCANLDSCSEDAKWMRNYCTNGDKYQPAPAVVLWRTE